MVNQLMIVFSLSLEILRRKFSFKINQCWKSSLLFISNPLNFFKFGRSGKKYSKFFAKCKILVLVYTRSLESTFKIVMICLICRKKESLENIINDSFCYMKLSSKLEINLLENFEYNVNNRSSQQRIWCSFVEFIIIQCHF